MSTDTTPPETTQSPAANEQPRPPRSIAWLVGLGVVALVACLPLLNISIPGVLPGATYTPGAMHLIALCMIYAALSLTYHLVYGVAGMLSFGHALYFAAGAYGLAVVLQRTDMPLLVAGMFVLLGALALATLVGAVSLRVSGVSFAMVTLAFAQAGNVIARRNMGGFSGGEEGIGLSTAGVPDALVGVVNTRNMYWVALALVVVVYLVVTWVQRSRAGHVVEATRENEMRVRVLGQAPYPIRLITFAIAGGLAAAVGMTYILLQSQAVPFISSAEFTIQALIMVVLGGVGSRWGAVVGAVVFTMLNQRLSVLASSAAVDGLPTVLRIPMSEPAFILGTLFILVVLFLPGGIAGGLRRLATRLVRGKGAARRGRVKERRRMEEIA